MIQMEKIILKPKKHIQNKVPRKVAEGYKTFNEEFLDHDAIVRG
ncbi:hypothetical protein AXFE_29380 [Acidithrix ferrooxidans]|uniref:Uncharacterized protein n=1 Tax=Acidithrix ferrooxidans TaxID=1280514 RepID=A0A0D8HE49_9ACTN|nr:hypothetical protein AXFE_29380 [Acidithrix ferrooxidans]CAG4906062.1 unnamed protein product [Acidithrix sp. C25]